MERVGMFDKLSLEAVARQMPWYLRKQFTAYLRYQRFKTLWRFHLREFKRRHFSG